MKDLKQLEADAFKIVDNVSNNPQGRYNLRLDFYKRYGHPVVEGRDGLGNSELAFLKWEIDRGVLNPMSGSKPGSPWWRSVNSRFIYLSTLADLIHKSGQSFDELPTPVTFWLDYIKEPNEVTWYKAHNSSISAGYELANSLAFKETVYEQYFMNIVLYRLLYAQSMVEGVNFGALGKIFADPRGGAVSIITDINAFYPRNYPMTKEEIKDVMHKAHNLPGDLEDIFDEVFILPGLGKLYVEAAQWDNSTNLLIYVDNNKPIYPIPSTAEHEYMHYTNQLIEKTIL